MVPPKGVAADFGFKVGQIYVGHIYITLDPAHNYAIKATAPFITDLEIVRGVQLDALGGPGRLGARSLPGIQAPSTSPKKKKKKKKKANSAKSTNPTSALRVERAVQGAARPADGLRLPQRPVLMSADSWNHPGQFTPVCRGRPR